MAQLLADWAAQDPKALDRLVPLVYDELRRLANYHMRGERAAHTLQTTALVHEVYLRLAGIKGLQWRDRAHFFALAGTLMRRVLVDYARRQRRDKRGGGVSVISLDGHAVTLRAGRRRRGAGRGAPAAGRRGSPAVPDRRVAILRRPVD